MFIYRKATMNDLNTIWDKDIKSHIDDKRYVKWKKSFIEANKNGDIITFVVLNENDPIGQCSIVLNKENIKFECKDLLCAGNEKAYLSTIRIDKQYEGQGHISKLVKTVETFAKKKGFSYLTIGVEAKESRNLAIYLHFGYTQFISSEIEDDALILFYQKPLKRRSYDNKNRAN